MSIMRPQAVGHVRVSDVPSWTDVLRHAHEPVTVVERLRAVLGESAFLDDEAEHDRLLAEEREGE